MQLRIKQILDFISSNPQNGDYFAYNSATGNYENVAAPLDGSSGTDGTSGTNGTDGSSGTDGTSGTDGSSGTNGTNGSSGTNGTDGSSGTNGTNGSSGYDGAKSGNYGDPNGQIIGSFIGQLY